MNVLVTLTSGFADTAQIPAAGILEASGDVLSVTWAEPPSGDEVCESLHQLSFDRSNGMLHMTRSGDNTTDLFFSERRQTQGSLITPYGEFSMDIDTKQLVVSEKLWMPLKKDKEEIGIQYFLLVSGQEPMQNHIIIQIELEKNGK